MIITPQATEDPVLSSFQQGDMVRKTIFPT